MPLENQFRHQSYPTAPAIPPSFHQLQIDDGDDAEFSRLHTDAGVHQVVVVHGTFMGDDPFGVAANLRAIGESVPALNRPLQSLAARLQEHTKPITDRVTGDVGNFTTVFRDRFQQLVGDDPEVRFLEPTWSGQNHHLARADLAVRLLCALADLQPEPDQRVLFWGHSHAGNGFAILSNLLANEPESVARFFEAASRTEPHWIQARDLLLNSPSPHPFAKSVMFAAFGTPVRYGWDPSGYNTLVHVLHHRSHDEEHPFAAKPMFPPHSFRNMVGAKYGDWVQAFAIAGTDVSSLSSSKSVAALTEVLEAGLEEPEHGLDTRFIRPKRIQNACARWKTGTRCHADGLNLLVEYEPGGRTAGLAVPIEESFFGHGVATTVDWLPAHLALVLKHLAPDVGAERDASLLR